MKDRNWFKQQLLHSVLPFSTGKLQNLISYCSKIIEISILLNPYIDWIEYLARGKVFHPHEREKLVHTEAPSVLLFLIGKLQDLTSYCKKLIEILILLNSYRDWIKSLARNKAFHQHEGQKLVHAGPPSVLLYFIGILQDLPSSCSKIIEIFS